MKHNKGFKFGLLALGALVIIPAVIMSLSKWLIPALIGGAVIYFAISEEERQRFRDKVKAKRDQCRAKMKAHCEAAENAKSAEITTQVTTQS